MHREPTRLSAPRRRSRSRRSSRSALLRFGAAVVAVAAIVLAWGIGTSIGHPTAEKPATRARPSAATESAPADGAQSGAPVQHVTFGAHTTATQPCTSCHRRTRPGEIACRDCHGDKCGKNAKTVLDCIKCHKTGTTDSWSGGGAEQ